MSDALCKLLSANREHYTILQAEATEALFNNEKSQSILSQLPRLDSMIREAMRQHSDFQPFPCVKVVAKEGVTLPTGELIPEGSFLGTATSDVHMDAKEYPEPEQFQPFRFVPEHSSEDQNGMKKPTPPGAQLLTATVTSTFLGFGAGRHIWYIISSLCNRT